MTPQLSILGSRLSEEMRCYERNAPMGTRSRWTPVPFRTPRTDSSTRSGVIRRMQTASLQAEFFWFAVRRNNWPWFTAAWPGNKMAIRPMMPLPGGILSRHCNGNLLTTWEQMPRRFSREPSSWTRICFPCVCIMRLRVCVGKDWK